VARVVKLAHEMVKLVAGGADLVRCRRTESAPRSSRL
jgi:hypothetical protein